MASLQALHNDKSNCYQLLDHDDDEIDDDDMTTSSTTGTHSPLTPSFGLRKTQSSPALSKLPTIRHFRQVSAVPEESIPLTLLTPPSVVSYSPIYTSVRFLFRLNRYLQRSHLDHSTTLLGFWLLLVLQAAQSLVAPTRDALLVTIGVSHLPALTVGTTLLALCATVPTAWIMEAPNPSRSPWMRKCGLTRGDTQGTSLALLDRVYAVVCFTAALAPPYCQWTIYTVFYLLGHVLKLHVVSLVWGVVTESMEYESASNDNRRLQRLGWMGLGGTVGTLLGSSLASGWMYSVSGLLLLATFLLEVAAQLSIEMGRLMQLHWQQEQKVRQQQQQQQQQSMTRNATSHPNLASLDSSMRRSTSLGSMKRVASGNSLARSQEVASQHNMDQDDDNDDRTFYQRLRRGAYTLCRSRLLLTIFTYNALYASTTTLLSFQRADMIVASQVSVLPFLARVNLTTSLVILVLQATGVGTQVATWCGPRGTLALLPAMRCFGVAFVAYTKDSLVLFLILDEACKILNMAVAKPVRESLWHGLSNAARYEAKPIVDALANRWGGASAAVLVTIWSRLQERGYIQASYGSVPSRLLLCVGIALWWMAVSIDLGQIRHRIDVELKKRQ